MRKLVIERAAIKNNVCVIKERAAQAELYAVLSGDGGADIAQLARVLRDEGVARFAVSECAQAQALRKAGFVDEEILMLRATTKRSELEQLMDLNVVCTVSSVDTGLALNALAENRSTVVEAHIQVDTGMGFGGFLIGEPEKILLAYRSLPNVALSGIYTQLHAVRANDAGARVQLERFKQVLETIQKAGFETGMVHAASSFSVLHMPEMQMDGVRVGTAILGRCRRRRGDGLKIVGYGEAQLSEVRWLPKGHTLGAGKIVTLKKPTRIAVLSVGYQNGFGMVRPRETGLLAAMRCVHMQRTRTVKIGQERAKIIGGIGATQTLLDVTNLHCAAGDAARFDIDPMFCRGFEIEYR